jgi:hypothetical protein
MSPVVTPSPARTSFCQSGDGDRVVASVTADSVDDALACLERLGRNDWRLALVFSPGRRELASIGPGLAQRWPTMAVAGCTSAGLLGRHGDVGARLQITVFGGDGFDARVVAAGLDGSSSREAGWVAAQSMAQLGHFAHPDGGDGQHHVLIVLADGLVGDANDVVRGAYDAVGAIVPIVGGCAGDDLAMEATHQLAGSAVLTRSVVGVALRSTAPLGIGVSHGWTPVGQPMTVTAVDGTSLLGLDDRPALDVYLEALGRSDDLTSQGLAVASQTRPLGLESRGGHHVRFVKGADVERRSVEFLVGLPEGELVTLMEGNTSSVLDAAGNAVEQAVAELGGDPLGIVAFDCVACRGVIGDDGLDAELDRVTRHLPPDAVVAGLYTYGEIARRGGALGFHNQTMVALAVR